VVRVARGQIAHGVDLIKIYADYRWGPNGETRPRLRAKSRIVEAANNGRPVVAHSSPEGMRNAIMAGVDTIEHGDEHARDLG
jgi:imidazolonepropionase-like amidohydrolase